MMTTSYLSLVRVQASNHILCDETMRVTIFRCCFLVFLACMVRCCYTTFSGGDIILEDEECAREAQDEEKKSEETLEKAEVENKAVQLLHLRFPRFPDVSVIY